MEIKKAGMGSHHKTTANTDEWLTPPGIIKELGPFDLDPCAPIVRPWPTAKNHFTIKNNGLMMPWSGRVWLNPPYGDKVALWLNKLALHGQGTALVFARTDTDWFWNEVWKHAGAILFLKKRLHFHRVDGSRSEFNGGAPSVLIAYGLEDSNRLKFCKLKGKYFDI